MKCDVCLLTVLLTPLLAAPADTYDVYVASDNLTVKVVDFNAIGGATSPLLFTWQELGLGDSSGNEGGPTEQQAARRPGRLAWPLRLVAPGAGMQAGQRAACAMPFDMLNLTDAGQIAALVEQQARSRAP